MSFLSEIQKFSKNSLKQTDTEVTTVGGRRVRETRDQHGCVISQVLSEGELGFVGDYKPDLQVAEVLPNLYFGSQDVAVDLNLLNSHSITHILNLAQIVENKFTGKFHYKKLDLLDLPETSIKDHFNECFKFIDQGRSNGAVLVHCNAGVSRASTVVIAYYMKTQGADFQTAFQHVKSIRPCIRPNDGFMKQLKEYKP